MKCKNCKAYLATPIFDLNGEKTDKNNSFGTCLKAPSKLNKHPFQIHDHKVKIMGNSVDVGEDFGCIHFELKQNNG